MAARATGYLAFQVRAFFPSPTGAIQDDHEQDENPEKTDCEQGLEGGLGHGHPRSTVCLILAHNFTRAAQCSSLYGMMRAKRVRVPSSGSDRNWFDEFKRANQGSPSPSPAPSPDPKPPSAQDQRRQHSRFDLPEASVDLLESGLLTAIGVGGKNLARAPIDLSEGGLRVLLHRRIKPGTRVMIQLEIESHGDSVEATGIVRWCFESGTKPGDYYAGVMFTNLQASQKRKIALMRDWFTSPQFRALKAGRSSKGERPPEISFSG